MPQDNDSGPHSDETEEDVSVVTYASSGPVQPAVKAVYADGGLIKSNPSPYGGTWATCHVDDYGVRVWEDKGILLPARWNGMQLENNQSEFFALLQGIKALPDGWRGWAYSDNQNTIRRFRDPYGSMNGIPKAWVMELREERRRLGEISFVLLSGHPSKKALKEGIGRGGRPVSAFNVWCDKQCQELGRSWWESQRGA